MTLPAWRDWAFSVKTFAAAMLALWIALQLDLDRPYWAMATVYIVAQPLAGAMRSKAAYRFYGTMLGAVVMLVLIPNLVNARELLTAALLLWIGACIYFAVLDRTPRSYVFLLAGYSVALIGLPSVDAPGAIWDIVLARVEEITLGIACTTVISSIVFPSALGPALTARLDAWLRDAADWTVGVLSGRPEDATTSAARRRVAGTAVEIGMLASHLAFDTSNLSNATRPVAMLQQRVMLLLPVVSGAADRIRLLRENDGITPQLRAVLDRLSEWIRAGRSAALAEADLIRADIDALEPAIDASADWKVVVLAGLLVRLRELTDLVHDIVALRRQIREGRRRLPDLAVSRAEIGRVLLHRDHAMALHSALASVLAVGLISAYWIGTAWPDGAQAAALAAVGCAFFAAQDDPAPSIVGFVYAAIVALVVDAIYLFAVLPQVHDFEVLVLVLAPVFLVFGVLASMPATARTFGPMGFLTASVLALSSSYRADFAAYANNGAAAIVGLGATAIIIRIVRSVSADWTAQRLLRRNRADIRNAALNREAAGRIAFAELMLDRFSLVVPRLGASAENADMAALAALRDLRVGINIVDLQRAAAGLPAEARHAVRVMLDAIAQHYRQRRSEKASPGLLAAIDRAISAATREPVSGIRDVLVQLGGIRRGLFPDAAPYAPETAAGFPEAAAARSA